MKENVEHNRVGNISRALWLFRAVSTHDDVHMSVYTYAGIPGLCLLIRMWKSVCALICATKEIRYRTLPGIGSE